MNYVFTHSGRETSFFATIRYDRIRQALSGPPSVSFAPEQKYQKLRAVDLMAGHWQREKSAKENRESERIEWSSRIDDADMHSDVCAPDWLLLDFELPPSAKWIAGKSRSRFSSGAFFYWSNVANTHSIEISNTCALPFNGRTNLYLLPINCAASSHTHTQHRMLERFNVRMHWEKLNIQSDAFEHSDQITLDHRKLTALSWSAIQPMLCCVCVCAARNRKVIKKRKIKLRKIKQTNFSIWCNRQMFNTKCSAQSVRAHGVSRLWLKPVRRTLWTNMHLALIA